jgi:Raf kinase inhibitor-like YbhB/YbcL family protein
MAFSLSSTVFGHMESIPSKYTCDGANISPPLHWTDVPVGTISVVLICDDPDAPVGTWVHWVCYDIPFEKGGLLEGVPKTDVIPAGGKQGINDFRKVGYGGPCPPSGTHRYFFKLYALDCMLQLHAGKSKEEVEIAMEGHVLGQTELVGVYPRK